MAKSNSAAVQPNENKKVIGEKANRRADLNEGNIKKLL